MFHVRVGEETVVYTGDYNMTPDRHLGAAWIDKVRPDLLITETTYATTIRDSKRQREREFLKNIHSCVEKGGKVRKLCRVLLGVINNKSFPTFPLADPGAHTRLCAGKSAGVVYTIGHLLGTNESSDSHLLLCR